MKDSAWLSLDDESLERLLIERWVLRGVLLAVMFAAAIATTYRGMEGIITIADELTITASVFAAFASGAVALCMRATDLRMQRELRRRRGALKRPPP